MTNENVPGEWRRFGRICTRFDEEKAASAAAVLLKQAGGSMPYMKLLKLLYLADRESWLKYNRPITGDKYVSMPHGPVLSNTFDLIQYENREGPWKSAIDKSGYDVVLRGEVDCGPLSEADVEILNASYELFEQLSQFGLSELTHKLPEWEDPDGSSIPIHVETILRVLGKSEEEIGAARQEALDNAHLEDLLGA